MTSGCWAADSNMDQIPWEGKGNCAIQFIVCFNKNGVVLTTGTQIIGK